jgi:sorting nexin-25
MSTNRKYVIASGVAAFIAWVVFLDGGLRWIPLAFVLGAISAVVGTLFVVATTAQRSTLQVRAVRIEHGPRAPAFTNRQRWEEEKVGVKGREEYRRPAIFPEVIRFSKTVDGLLDLVLRDFITSWYGKISPRPLFQHEIDRVIRAVLLSIIARLTDKDLVEVGVAGLLPFITNHLKDFYDAERAVRGKDLATAIPDSDEVSTAIASKYRNGKLHAVASLAHANTATTTQEYLRKLIQKILPKVLPANMKSSPAVLVLVREIVACAVLAPIINMLVEPDTWNQMIVNIGGAALRDRKTVRRVRAALDEHAPASARPARKVQFPQLRPYDSERQFERFIRAIRQLESLNDARRHRSEIVAQLTRDSLVEGQDAAYLRRLETGKRLLDQQITRLTSLKGALSDSESAGPSARMDLADRKRQATLREIIYDTAGLSLLMEYMDRHKATKLVQFYLAVDGDRNPLEGDGDEASPTSFNSPDRMNIKHMYENYLTKPELHVSEHTLQPVRSYLKAGNAATSFDYVAARRSVLQHQTEVYNIMKTEHFEGFKRSEMYEKWLSINDQSSMPPPPLPVRRTATPPPLIGSRLSYSGQLPTRRPQLAALHKDPELRRAVFSTSDLKSLGYNGDSSSDSSRRSLEDANTRPSLFGDDLDDDPMVKSTPSIKSYDSDGERAQRAQDEAKAVSAVQLALDDIVGDEDRDSLFADSSARNSLDEADRPIPVQGVSRPVLAPRASSNHGKPSIASLGLVGAPSSRGVFVDDLFGDETQKFAEDEKEDSDALTDQDDEGVREAAPGDLGLTEAIDVLNADIERLNAQRNVLDSLTAKAELTNNTAELRILKKSEQSLQREIKRKEMQKQQYVVQESDNSLFGRAVVRINSVMVGKEEDGHEFALYVIEVRRKAGDSMPAAVWAVTRRYSQFHELHKRLKARFPAVRELDFPRRQALFTLQKDVVEKRRGVLERYLRSLLLVPAICRSRELRAFLSQSAIASHGNNTNADAKDFVTRIYNSVSDGMEDFLGNIPVLDQLSVAGQNLISAATAQISGGASIDSLDPVAQNPSTAAEAEAELNAYETKKSEPFVKPICDLFLEVFELSKGNSWLRGRTAVVVLHQLLGGTIERKARETAKTALEDDKLAGYVESLKSTMWPDGKMRPSSVPRTPAEKARTRKEAALLLEALMPDIAGSVVGKYNAQAAGRKIVAVLNNPRLK